LTHTLYCCCGPSSAAQNITALIAPTARVVTTLLISKAFVPLAVPTMAFTVVVSQLQLKEVVVAATVVVTTVVVGSVLAVVTTVVVGAMVVVTTVVVVGATVVVVTTVVVGAVLVVVTTVVVVPAVVVAPTVVLVVPAAAVVVVHGGHVIWLTTWSNAAKRSMLKSTARMVWAISSD